MLNHRLAFWAVLLVAASAFGQDDEDEQPPGLLARYQVNQSVVERVDPDISFDWVGAAPDERLPAGKFSASWSGTLLLRSADKYRFHVFTQGRVALKVNGLTVLEGEADKPQWLIGDETALAFGEQPFELSFVRTGDAAQLKLYWSSNDFPLEPVPYHSLFQAKASPQLTLIERGRVQFEAFRCANCHGEAEGQGLRGAGQGKNADADNSGPLSLSPRRSALPAPSLKHVGQGTSRDWLVAKLTDTAHREAAAPTDKLGFTNDHFANSKMPAFGFTRSEAEAVVAALIDQATPVQLDAPPKLKDAERDKDLQAGRTLIRSVGCLACHTYEQLGEATPFGGGALTDIGQRRSSDWLATWLAKPTQLNEHARMPVVSLSDKERAQIVLALLVPSPPSSGERGEGTGKEDPAQVARGRTLIESSRCAACHELTQLHPQPVLRPPLVRVGIDWAKSCLTATDKASSRPRVANVDAKAIQAYVASWGGRVPTSLALQPEPSTIDRTAQDRRLLEQKNCLACHDRDESKGLSRLAASIAKVDESLAGLHMTLIPPRLNAVGDRLHDAALAEAIRGDQKTVRLNWLRVRMPKFQHTPVEQAALLAHLIGHDRVPERAKGQGLRGEGQEPEKSVSASPSLVPQPSPPADPQRVLAGRELLGGKGFSCVACHAVKDYTPKVTALGTRGSNLHLLGQRMRADYYFRWTRAPLRIMPGGEMPNYQRPHEFILPGQLDLQLTAIWEALNDPNLTAPTNPAVVEQLLAVQPGERPRIVRDVFTVPGGKDGETVARSFAIGFDNGHSLLFDLDTGSVRGWTLGDFARQRCEGKRWYWDLAGVPLATGFDARPDVFLVDTKTNEVIAPETGWDVTAQLEQYHEVVHFKRYRVNRLRYRLRFAKDGIQYNFSVSEIFLPDHGRGEVVRRLVPSGLEKTSCWPWFRNSTPQNLHEAAAITTNAGDDDRPRGAPPNSRPFARHSAFRDGGLVQTNEPILEVKYTSSLNRVDSSAMSAATSLTSPSDQITSVPGFHGRRLPLPRSIMPTAMTFDDWRRLVFTSLKGQVFRVENVAGKDGAEELTTLVEGLAAPFGVLWIEGDTAKRPIALSRLLVAHKPELLKLTLGADDSVPTHDVLATGWGLTDDYHDWTCGIARDSKGNLFIGLASDYTFKNRPKEKSRWRGDILRIDPAGKIESIARGLRYPTGLAIDDQDRLFVTDQQGVQNTFNELNYIQPGHRYGVPSRHEPEPNAPADPPTVQIPHPWTRSANGIVFVPRRSRESRGESQEPAKKETTLRDALLGPVTRHSSLDSLGGHFLAAEYNNNSIIRMSVQEVDGIVQGAVYPFSRPTSDEDPLSATPNSGGTPIPRDSSSFIGPICLGISPAGEIYVGGFQDGGWAGGLNMGDIVKLTPEGELPNGLREIRATPHGFDLEFFHPVDAERAHQTSQYKLSGYTRVWKGDYATPDSGRHTGEVRAATLSRDGRTVSLVVAGLKPGHVYDVSVGDIGTGEDRTLWPAIGHYTLHRIPH